jgi:putative cell wall-binding protein
VYLGDPAEGRLIGAVAYGFSSGPSSIAGLTPAEDLLELLHDGATTPNGTGEQVMALAGEGDPAAAGLRRLPTPLAVSGLARRSQEQLQAAADRAGLPVLVTPGGIGSATEVGSGPVAGGNFAAVLSTGDVTSAAIGTTSIACAGRLVALAHEFNASGSTLMAAHGASALAIVDDPSTGPFKLANVGQPLGRLDQDRWSGVRAELGPAPETIPVVSEVTAGDRAVTRTGETGVVRSADVPLAAGLHLVGNIDATIDRIGPGSASLTTRVSGTGADGEPFTFARSNLFVSETDISQDLAYSENYDALVALMGAGATFETVGFTATVSADLTRYEVDEVRIGVDGGQQAPATGEDLIVARPGARLDIGVTLRSSTGEQTVPVELAVTVPQDATGGTLTIAGAQPPGFAQPVPPETAAPEPGAVEQVLAALAARPTNAELSARFQPYEQEAVTADLHDAVVLDRVVAGQVTLPVVVEPAPFALQEVDGADRVATAVALSAEVFDAAETVVLARSDGYADALAAAPLAATLGAPVLLTDPGELRADVSAEVERLGASEAILLGGAQALGGAVADGLEEQGLAVRRVAGSDRFDTARHIALQVGGRDVYLTRGGDPDPARGWPDALAVSALAAAQQRPILLAEPGGLPQATREALETLDVEAVTVVGGPAAIEPRVLEALDDHIVRRVAGEDRYATSLAVAELAVEAGQSPGRVTLATGHSFPDALAAGPAVAEGGGLLLLLDGRDPAGSPATYQYLEGISETLDEVRFLGGPAAITPSVRAAVNEALGSFVGVVPSAPEPDGQGGQSLASRARSRRAIGPRP